VEKKKYTIMLVTPIDPINKNEKQLFTVVNSHGDLILRIFIPIYLKKINK